ncbi:MAG: hypothetical protein AB4426_18795 [Xenococcaceae cyanobacterium]
MSTLPQQKFGTTESKNSQQLAKEVPVIAKHNHPRKLICRWVPTGKSYPKMVAQWMIAENDSQC